MLVAEQLLVLALGRVVPHEVDPQLGPIGELGDEALELRRREVPAARAGNPGHCSSVSCRARGVRIGRGRATSRGEELSDAELMSPRASGWRRTPGRWPRRPDP